MKILFTGGSSFSGMWFVQELARAGHEVVATLRGAESDYIGLRRERIGQLVQDCRLVFTCPFGTPSFLQLISGESWDILCHHAADVTHYKSPDFDPIGALANNAHRLRDVLHLLAEKDCRRIVLTGSVFEQGEGAGSDELRAVSPYGLSKGLTAEFFRFYCAVSHFRLGKFVIPNPFGPYEELRFTSYLAKTWLQSKRAVVSYPDYVRDNIPISLLAKAYVHFVEGSSIDPGFHKWNPSFYVESQGAFTQRFAGELRSRLGIECSVDMQQQTDFSEPLERVNSDTLDPALLRWSEPAFWDALAEYYSMVYRSS